MLNINEPRMAPRNGAFVRKVLNPCGWFAAWYDHRGFATLGKSFKYECEAIVYAKRLAGEQRAKAMRVSWSRHK